MQQLTSPIIIIAVDPAKSLGDAANRLRQADIEFVEIGKVAEIIETIRRRQSSLVIAALSETNDFGARVCRAVNEESARTAARVLQIVPDSMIDERGMISGGEIAADAVITESVSPSAFLAAVRNLRRQRSNNSARTETAHAKIAGKWNLAMSASNIGTWNFDAAQNKLLWSEDCIHLFGVPHDAGSATMEEWLERVQSDDREQVREKFTQAESQRQPLEIEYQSATNDLGETRWIKAAGEHFYDDANHTTSLSGLFFDVTKQKQIEEKLLESERAARQEAEFANRAKDEFLAVLSHELRTPLNAMYGWARMLASGTLDEAMQKRAVEIIERNIQHQSKLIEDVLDISRIVSGKTQIEPHRMDLTALLESIVETSRPTAAAKQIEIAANFADQPIVISGDGERLQQVFSNIINNSIKFTPANGTITVELKAVGDIAEIRLTDSGIGIRAEYLPYIFDRFQQAENGGKKRHSGLGLGLAIVKHLTELHGGTVQAESAGENQGATFMIEIPLDKTT